MNRSPSLKDIIRSYCNIDSLNIIGYQNKNYVSESDILSFMKENDIESKDAVISSICEFNHISEINIIDENSSDDLKTVSDFCSLLEALDVDDVIKVSSGKKELTMYLDQIAAFIFRREYDKVSELDTRIKQCTRILEDIDEERKVANTKKNSSYKFSARYIINIVVSLFKIFVLPLVVSKSYKLPGSLIKIYNKIKKPLSGKNSKKVLNIGLGVADTAEDIGYLYMSFKDYEGLLDVYYSKIDNIRKDLIRKKKKLEAKQSLNGGL